MSRLAANIEDLPRVRPDALPPAAQMLELLHLAYLPAQQRLPAGDAHYPTARNVSATPALQPVVSSVSISSADANAPRHVSVAVGDPRKLRICFVADPNVEILWTCALERFPTSVTQQPEFGQFFQQQLNAFTIAHISAQRTFQWLELEIANSLFMETLMREYVAATTGKRA